MFFRYNWIGIVWSIIIFVLSILPGKDIPEVDIINIDKIVHIVIYSILMIFSIWGLGKQYAIDFLRSYSKIIAILYGTIFGVLMEAIQFYFCKNRYFEVNDIIANFIGCLTGSLVFSLIKKNI